ncbi:MAG: hypothetical protein ACI84C_002659 [Flavobacteriales bacterium]|jgi:hypothetical protein
MAKILLIPHIAKSLEPFSCNPNPGKRTYGHLLYAQKD